MGLASMHDLRAARAELIRLFCVKFPASWAFMFRGFYEAENFVIYLKLRQSRPALQSVYVAYHEPIRYAQDVV